MNIKIIIVALLLVASLGMSGCLDKPKATEYKIEQITKIDATKINVISSDDDEYIYSQVFDFSKDTIIYSNTSKLIRQGFGMYVLYLNKSDIRMISNGCD